MKVPEPKNPARKIASKNHNTYLAEGIAPHKATKSVPSSLLQSFSEELKYHLSVKQKVLETQLFKVLGNPFYADNGFILYHGDTIDFLNKLTLTNINIDLTVTSPPYNIGKEYETPMSVDEYITSCSQWMSQIYKITQANGAFWLNVGHFQVPDQGLCVPIPYLLWDKSPFYLLQEVVWQYGAGVSTKYRLSPRNEKWLFYVKDAQNYTFNLDDIRDANVKYPHQKRHGKYRCNPLGKNPSDVWEFPKITTGKKRSSKERTGHPAQFPLGVVERVVKACSNQLEVVLDPFAGSGSTGIAAVGLGRIFLGFEIRSDYCEMAVERFKAFQVEREVFSGRK
ncbi:site-specific DNA-methyltransferase [Nodularia harveyana UHCC-0300]|uniref:Methyltransferase n=1 Tax=Nodularia harveyana UHCC-0300 TaxID=2974287 RepID=A0ABU5UEN9_9CYAN|nr:site-specific DNA-methyltransferase [Nodularia harveyana]MEA5581451.1 site-specific DNA-methyltransferase [Nodularia harveyana UHCC-0300]